MNIILKTTEYILPTSRAWISPEYTTAAILLSANAAKGNDGRFCPLLHSSLAPMLVSNEVFEANLLSLLVLNSNTITWTKSISLFYSCFRTRLPDLKKICEKLASTRYFSEQLRELNSSDEEPVLELISKCCRNLELIELTNDSQKCSNSGDDNNNAFSFKILQHVGSTSLKQFTFRYGHFSDFDLLVKFKKLEKLQLEFVTIADDDFEKFGALTNLRILKLASTRKLTGSSFAPVFSQMPFLSELKIASEGDDGISDIGGVGFATNLVSLSVAPVVTTSSSNSNSLAIFAKWKDFPLLETFNFTCPLDFPRFENLSPLPNIKSCNFICTSGEFGAAGSMFLLDKAMNLVNVELLLTNVTADLMNALATMNYLENVAVKCWTSQPGDDPIFLSEGTPLLKKWTGPRKTLKSVTFARFMYSGMFHCDFLLPCRELSEMKFQGCVPDLSILLRENSDEDEKSFFPNLKTLRILQIKKEQHEMVDKMLLLSFGDDNNNNNNNFVPKKQIESITEFDITASVFNDQHMEKFVKIFPNIERLSIHWYRQLTKQSLNHFRKLCRLKSIFGITSINLSEIKPDELEAFKKDMPRVEID